MKTNLLLAGFLLAAVAASAATLPSIVTVPASQAVAEGGMAVLTTTATGALPLTFKWKKNGMPTPYSTTTVNDTNCTLVLSNLTASDSCWFLLSVSNAVGESSGKQIFVAVLSPRTETNGFSLTIRATTNTLWRIECNTNFPSTNWVTLTNLSIPRTPPLFKYVDPAGTNLSRFYRVFPRAL